MPLAIPRLCLNMIVKNEAAILERCLAAVAPYIDAWVIGDTGSTDETPVLVERFFGERAIKGELHRFPFENFGAARNRALGHAKASALEFDYVLFVDADMEFVVDNGDFRRGLSAHAYALRQNAAISYFNTRLVRRDVDARYVGVTHEYLDVGPPAVRLDGAWFIDHANGSNRGEKCVRDLRLLRKAIEDEPGNARCWFYLAQTYRDAGRDAEAIETYGHRAEMGGYDEEIWYSRWQEARALLRTGDAPRFLRQALAAYSLRPHRAEPLYDLARYFRDRGEHASALLFCETGQALPYPSQDQLFIEDFVYRTGLDEEFSIAAYYSTDPARRERGRATCNSLALSRDVPISSRSQARSNLAFYARPAVALMPSFVARTVDFVPPAGHAAMNPSIAGDGDALWLLQRAVNYRLTDSGHYVTDNGAPITTRNFLLGLDADLRVTARTEIASPDDLPPPRYGLVRGFEDARLFACGGALWCAATVRELNPEGWCEIVLARIDGAGTDACRLADWRALRRPGAPRHEKNWMPFSSEGELRFVYGLDPTMIVDDRGATVVESVPGVATEHLRGGSQCIAFDGGHLALVHEVAIIGVARHYLHRFVHLDAEFRLRALSMPFKLSAQPVEFAAGLAWHPDGERLIASFGVADRESQIAFVAAADVRSLLAQ